jgi:hypothetical protein
MEIFNWTYSSKKSYGMSSATVQVQLEVGPRVTNHLLTKYHRNLRAWDHKNSN